MALPVPPVTSVNVIGAFQNVQLTGNVGHGGGIHRRQWLPQRAGAVWVLPSFTVTVAVYVPGLALLKSQATALPSDRRGYRP